MTKPTDMEFISMLTDPNTLESGLTINSMALAQKSGKTVASTSVNTKTPKNMAKESIPGRMETSI